MEEQQEEIVGYLHNVSPVKKTNKASYFDMCIQTDNDPYSEEFAFLQANRLISRMSVTRKAL